MKIVTFDLETTGVDTENDRILTCFMRAKDGGKVVFEQAVYLYHRLRGLIGDEGV